MVKGESCEEGSLKIQRQKKRTNYFLRFALLCFILFVPAVFLSRSADALPVFARKYETACQTCHWATFPALNPFGQAFKDNGYRFPEDDETFVKESPVAFGGPAWKKMFPNAVWPSTIAHNFPAALLIESDFTVTPKTNRTLTDYGGKTAFNGVTPIELFTAGTLGESLSWFGHVGLYANQGGATVGESGTWSQRFFVVYTPHFLDEEHPATKGLFNVQVGRFEPRAKPRSEHLSIIGTSPYLFSTWGIVPTANFNSFFASQDGVEFFGGKNGPKGNGGFLWAAGIVNGAPRNDSTDVFASSSISDPNVAQIVANTKAAASGSTNPFDVNNSKDYYARVSYKIGGMGVLGGGKVEESKKALENWQEKSFTLGSFFYRGNAGFFENPAQPTPVGGGFDQTGSGWHPEGNHFWRYGAEAEFSWMNLNLFGAATFFRDRPDNVVTITDSVTGVTSSGRNFDADLYTAELRYVVLPWVIPAVRFENMNPSYDAGAIRSFNRYSGDLTFVIRANVKAVIGGAFSDGRAPKMPFFDDVYRMGVLIGL